jgi:hypothetical protein
VPATDGEEPARARPEHRLVEAVVSSSSPLVNQSIRDANFRTVYNAAVIAVHRNGERVAGKIGTIKLEAGDTLLLQGAPGFRRAHRNNPDFYLISEIPGTTTPRYDRAGLSIAILLMMALAASLGIYPISIAAFLACALLLATHSITAGTARRSVDWSILSVPLSPQGDIRHQIGILGHIHIDEKNLFRLEVAQDLSSLLGCKAWAGARSADKTDNWG